jgi:hypothetical protein
MTPIEKAKGHFRELTSGSLRGPLHVEEWDLDVYYLPVVSLKTMSEAMELQQKGKMVEAFAALLQARALDENGKPLFTKSDQRSLINSVDPKIINRIIDEMDADTKDFDLGN